MDELKVLKEVFVSLVNRSPSSEEIELFINAGVDTSDGKSIKTALLDSPERLYFNANELWQRCLGTGLRSTFFLHLPRTGGTAFTAALSEVFGIPAMLVQDGLNGVPIHAHGNVKWPIKTGHVPIDNIEDGVQIVSIARDPRTRLLSQFRFMQNSTAKRTKSLGFEKFIEEFGSELNPLGLGDGAAMFAERKNMNNCDWPDIPVRKRREFLLRGMSRIAKMAWNESETQLQEMIRFVGGKDSKIARHNQSASLGGFVDEAQVVASKNLKKIIAIVGMEMEYIEAGLDIGVLECPNFSEMDVLFDEMCDQYRIKFTKSAQLKKIMKLENMLGTR
jgi:hypothetical protein